MGLFDAIKKAADVVSDLKKIADQVEEKASMSSQSQPAYTNMPTQKAAQSSEKPAVRKKSSGEALLRSNLEKVIIDEWADYELKRGVSSSELEANGQAWDYSYGLYKDGQPVAMFMVLTNRNDYNRKAVRLSHEACDKAGISCMIL